MMNLLKQLVRTRTDIYLWPSELIQCYAICNQPPSYLHKELEQIIASHINFIKLSFDHFLKSKWTDYTKKWPNLSYNLLCS